MTPTTSFVLVTLAGAFYAAGIGYQMRVREPRAKDALVHLSLSGTGVVLNLIPVIAFMVPSTDWSHVESALHATLGLVSLGMILVLVTVGGALFRYKLRSGLYATGLEDAFTRKVRRGLRRGGIAWAALWVASYLTGVGLYFGG